MSLCGKPIIVSTIPTPVGMPIAQRSPCVVTARKGTIAERNSMRWAGGLSLAAARGYLGRSVLEQQRHVRQRAGHGVDAGPQRQPLGLLVLGPLAAIAHQHREPVSEVEEAAEEHERQ